MEEMLVKELKDIQQHIKDILPTPEIMEMMRAWYINSWIEKIGHLSEDVQELFDSLKAISKDDVDQLKQRFLELTTLIEENPLDDIEELKAMEVHIKYKLADAEGDQIGRGATMQKWLNDKMRHLGLKIEALVEYYDHLKEKNVSYCPCKLRDMVQSFQEDFRRVVIWEEALRYWGISLYRGVVESEEEEEVRVMVDDDIETMSMWINFILTSTASQGITEEAKRLLHELENDLLRRNMHIHINDFDGSPWTDLRWRFYKMRQLECLLPVTKHVNWNLFGFTKREAVGLLKQLKAMRMHIEEKLADAKEWEETQGEGMLLDNTRVLFQQVRDLLDHYEHVQLTEILTISRLQVGGFASAKKLM